jgi:hypothetical protein
VLKDYALASCTQNQLMAYLQNCVVSKTIRINKIVY